MLGLGAAIRLFLSTSFILLFFLTFYFSSGVKSDYIYCAAISSYDLEGLSLLLLLHESSQALGYHKRFGRLHARLNKTQLERSILQCQLHHRSICILGLHPIRLLTLFFCS